MKKAYIWDLDGTLLDSYDVIVESLHHTFLKYGIDLTREQIHRFAITYSSSALIEKMAGEKGLNPQLLYDSYAHFSREKYHLIKTMPHAYEILETLKDGGASHYVYTHRGMTTLPVLRMLGMDSYFEDVLTSKSGFPRKPAPDAIDYLLEKYHLSKDDACYVGDRTLDMESAKSAGIAGILYLPEGSRGAATGIENYVVHDLLDILNIQ